MSRTSTTLGDELYEYLVSHNAPFDEVQAALVEETKAATGRAAGMQLSREHANFLTMLTRLIGVKHAVEVGTFTGMSSLAIARGMAPDGKLICFDISEDYTSIARRYWERAGVADRVELRLGQAKEGLTELPDEPYLDLAFIDADKTNYQLYWDALVPRMRPGGVIMVDNVLWGGKVLDPRPSDPDTWSIVGFNAAVAADDRMESVMLPIADGVTLGRKK
jgi:caffeoyl-CoA O-methyltransferase